MKFLLVAKQKKNVDAFVATIARLLESGHEVALAIQDRDEDRDVKLLDTFGAASFSLQTCPAARSDGWIVQAPLIRRIRDWVQYLGSQYTGATKLRQRTVEKLQRELGPTTHPLGSSLVATLDQTHVQRLTALLTHIEASIPSDPLYEEFITRDKPDVVLVTPGLHFGSGQADFIKSTRAAGIPVWMLLFSWDNLSTKGALHVFPDLMFVWNERQRREAVELHRFPADRVVVVGAPRFDEFFALRPTLSRDDFFSPLGLSADAPTLLYLCSSRFVAQHELPFVRRWLEALRRSPHSALAACNVVVRPHPDIALLDHTYERTNVEWPGQGSGGGVISRPFDDARAIVLQTSGRTQQPFFECLFHSSAVIGLNTSGALEAGIVGRPVFTVVADDEAVTGQSNTLHFHYLLRESGGFVNVARDLQTHAEQLNTALTGTGDDGSVRRFVDEFLRPCGERPVSMVLADALVERCSQAQASGERQVSDEPSMAESGTLSAASRWEPSKTLRLAYPDSTVRVWATRETRKSRRPGQLLLDEQTIAWLDEHVKPGDVVYDIGASIGAYSLIAAMHRGALVVAFEPEFGSHKRLCDNILLNNCRRRILPLPIALGDCSGLAELEVRHNRPSGDGAKSRPWRNRPDGPEWRFNDPVCIERLDDVVVRHQLPRATHIRIAVASAADAVLRGASELLRPRSLRSVLVSTNEQSCLALTNTLTTAGLSSVATKSAGERQFLLFTHHPRNLEHRTRNPEPNLNTN